MITTILLDIDRTLVHAIHTHLIHEEWKTKYETFDFDEYTVFIRPNLYTFLDYLFKTGCKIGLYTAGDREYAEFIRDTIFTPRGYYLDCLFSQSECINRGDTICLTKSLHLIGRRLQTSPKQLLLIDDSSAIKRDITAEMDGYEDHCYLVRKFVVCLDGSNTFIPQMVEEDGLLVCMREISKLLLK